MSDAAPSVPPGEPPAPPAIRQILQSGDPLNVRLRDVLRHPTSQKFMKYASVSVVSTVVAQVTLILVFGVFRLMPAVPANVLATVLATIPSYVLNRRWVWQKGGKSSMVREVLPFWVLSFAGLGFSTLAVWIAQVVARSLHLSHFATSVLVNLSNLLSNAILWVVKFLAYERMFHIAPVEHPDATDLVELRPGTEA